MPGLTAGKHALLSPSAAARWMRCPASVVMTRDLPEDSSSYAFEGTCAHRLAELLLNGEPGFPADEAAKVIAAGVDPESLEAPVRVYVDYVRSLGSEVVTEVSLDISKITGEPEARGTSDAVVFTDGVIHVCDLKFGKGERVSAEENPQLAIYAGAALAAFDFLGEVHTVCMHIVQPRLNNISMWRLSKAELQAFLEGVRESAGTCLNLIVKAEAVEKLIEFSKLPTAAGAPIEGEPTPSSEYFHPSAKACRFCRHRGKCGALAKFALSVGGLDLPSQLKASLDGEQMAYILSQAGLIKTWLTEVEAAAHAALLDGQEVPGYKLVEGRAGSRKWSDEAKAEKLLKAWKVPADYRYVKTLISPTQAEKLIKLKTISAEQWDELCGYVSREPGKPTVVPASDKRPAISGKPAAEEFPDESAAK